MNQTESAPGPISSTGAFDPLGKLERIGIVALLIGVIVFGTITEIRSAFLQRRMTDVDTYFRAAWAIRVHKNPYDVTDPNHWHYNYPPLLAIALYPLADAPAKYSRAGLPPYPVSVAIWYVISIATVWIGTNALAKALEKTSSDPQVRSQPRYCRRWWGLRIIPILACLPALGRSLARGQVNSILLMLFCFAGAGLAYRREVRAGFSLGLAAAIKIFPAFLILYGIWRLRWKVLVGAGIGLILGVLVIPLAVMGPQRMMTAYHTLNQVVLEPALGLNHNQSRGRELLDVNKTDSTSFLAIIDHISHLGEKTPAPTKDEKIAHWTISFVLVALTLLGERLWRKDDPIFRNLFLGTLIVIMLPIIPICHPHYFCMVLPLVVTLVAAKWEYDQKLPIGWGLGLVLIFFALSHIFTVLPPPFYILRNLGLVTYGGMVLWGAGMVAMWKWQPAIATATPPADNITRNSV